MSLTTDGLAVGAAFAVAVGSAIQASQAFAELNAKTPLKNSLLPLFWAALEALFLVVLPRTDPVAMAVQLVRLDLLTAKPAELTPEQAAALTPEEVVAVELTPEQIDALDVGQDIALTPDQTAALTGARVKDLKKWLGWYLRWFFIMIGAIVALAGAALMLVNDL
jgi:hypothetical protein